MARTLLKKFQGNIPIEHFPAIFLGKYESRLPNENFTFNFKMQKISVVEQQRVNCTATQQRRRELKHT
jgi:hypothetical protein